jgi:hypothetical protein
MKREIPLMITFVVCLLLLIQFFCNIPALDKIATSINDYTSIVAVFAMVLGLASLTTIHANRIYRKQGTWKYSIVLIIGFLITVVVGMRYGIDKTWPLEITKEKYEFFQTDNERIQKANAGVTNLYAQEKKHKILEENVYFLKIDEVYYEVPEHIYTMSTIPESRKKKETHYIYEKGNYFYDLIFERVYSPLQATMFSLLAFFMASAAFRAFRAKSLEASLLLISAFLVMLGRVSIGESLGQLIGWFLGWMPWFAGYDWSTLFTGISQFIMEVPNSAGQRAIMIGAALGIVSASLRIWLGLEREHLGRD